MLGRSQPGLPKTDHGIPTRAYRKQPCAGVGDTTVDAVVMEVACSVGLDRHPQRFEVIDVVR